MHTVVSDDFEGSPSAWITEPAQGYTRLFGTTRSESETRRVFERRRFT
jgi:hypothetical protein